MSYEINVKTMTIARDEDIPLPQRIKVVIIEVMYGFLVTLYMVYSIIRNRGNYFRTKVRDLPPNCLLDPSLGAHHYIQLKDIKLHYVSKGNENNQTMLFIHGFPEFWYSWRHQIQEFAKDYHVIAVDTRGYGDSGQPTGFLNYKVDKTIEDMCHLMNALNKRRIVLVGHGWGGIVCWQLAAKYPELIHRLVVLSAPHPLMYRKFMKSWRQYLRSWYMFFFSLPTPLPEWALAGNDYFMLDYLYRTGDGRPLLADEHMEAYKYTFQQNGLTAPLNWYRANLAGRYPIRIPPKYLNIKVPTLLVWGKKDQLLSWKMAAAHRYVDDLTVHCIDNCSHWAAQECPDLVNQYMRKFLTHHSL